MPLRLRRLLQFSLRSLLAGAALCAVALAIWANQVRPYYVEQAAIKHIIKCGGEVRSAPLGPAWVNWISGEKREQRVVTVNVNVDLKPEDEVKLFAALREFQCLEDLKLRSANLNDERLRWLGAMHSLRRLTLE